MEFDWLIVGAGFTGGVLAERIATQLGQRVVIVDRRNHIAGNAYDYRNEQGTLVHKYGPHIFHTNSDKVWNYLSGFTEWRPYQHRVRALVDGMLVPVPFNLCSLQALFDSRSSRQLEAVLLHEFGYGTKVPVLKLREHSNPDVRQFADYVYQKIFYGYTVKQWELTPEELSPAVTARVPVRISRDDRYFDDKYQAMPLHGYTAMFKRMLCHPNISLLLDSDYRQALTRVKFNRLIMTGPIDEFFDYIHGPLPYRSLRFEFATLRQEIAQDVGTINYPNDYAFTRITELKHLTGDNTNSTTLVTEYPQGYVPGENEPYYPIPRDFNQELYDRYLAEVRKLNGSALFAGRLADYRYYNMDQAVGRALKTFEDIATQ